jgi:hypothetical protein
VRPTALVVGSPSVNVGTTLFSFTDEWRAGGLGLTGLLERVAAHGLGPDVEVVGYQSFRGLPAPYDHEVEAFRSDVRRLGLRPTAFGVYVDRARRPDRWLTLDEAYAELAGQLRVAARLGCTSVRAVLGMDLAVLDRSLPLLDELGLVLTFEIQGSHTPGAGDVTALVDWLERNAGAPVGITLDTSVAMPDLPVSYRRTLRREGMTPNAEEALDAAWRADGPPHQRMAGFHEAVEGMDVPVAALEHVVTAFVRFGHGDAEDWRFVLPWVWHAHAKFWDWDEAQRHVLEPHGRFLDLLVTAGYIGSVSSEFGGMAWLERGEVDVFDLTARHLAFLRSEIARLTTGRVQTAPAVPVT